jgi:hypothetical protein
VEFEKFLFYRGVGNFGLPMSVRFEGDLIQLQSADVGRVIVFENRGGQIGFTVCDAAGTVARPALGASLDALWSAFAARLIEEGLYEKEAEAMLQTWRDSWFEEGLRVFYVLPRATTDAVLPITIEPAPAELARVMVGRMEIITPEMEASILQAALRDAPATALKKYERFAEPVLKRLLARTVDDTLRTRLRRVIQR